MHMLTALKFVCRSFLFLLCYISITQSATAAGTEGGATAGEGVASVGKLRSSAEVAFSKGEIDTAIKLWAKVIELEPSNDSNFYKRFRVFLRQMKFKEALSDLNSALSLKPSNDAALAQRGKLQLRMGRCTDAVADFVKLRSVNPSSKDLSSQQQAEECSRYTTEADIHYSHGNWHAARDYLSQAIRFAENAPALLMKRAWCNYYTQDYYEAIADTGKVLKMESDSIAALELRGSSYYTLGELDMAMNHYRQGLKFDPEHKDCKSGYRLVKKVQGFNSKAQKAMASGDFNAAVKHLNALIDADKEHRTIVPQALLDLASAHKALKQIPEAKAAASRAVSLNENNAQAHKIFGDVLMEAEEWEEAVRKYRRASELSDGDHSIEDAIRRAEAALKQSKQKDYYKILGVSRKATKKEIAKAYKKLALKWHPDKQQGEEAKEEAEKQFQLIGEAKEILYDDEKRQMYDRGEDVFPNQGGGGGGGHGHPFAHHFQHFQQGHQNFHFEF